LIPIFHLHMESHVFAYPRRCLFDDGKNNFKVI